MNRSLDESGFNGAMAAGKTWTILDCTLSEFEDGSWYYEIDKSVFYGGPAESDKAGKTNVSHEQVTFGKSIDDTLDSIEKVWTSLIEKYNPDEYFVDQINYNEIDYQKLSDQLDKEAAE